MFGWSKPSPPWARLEAFAILTNKKVSRMLDSQANLTNAIAALQAEQKRVLEVISAENATIAAQAQTILDVVAKQAKPSPEIQAAADAVMASVAAMKAVTDPEPAPATAPPVDAPADAPAPAPAPAPASAPAPSADTPVPSPVVKGDPA